MVRNKYLDDLGITRENYASNFIKDGKIQRFIERGKYGFDYRQTVNMDLIFAEWLYSRLMMLLEQTMDDLTYNTIEFEGKTYTIEQAINYIIDASKEYLYYYEMVWGYVSSDEEETERINVAMKSATRLWAEVMPYADRTVISKRALRRIEKDVGRNYRRKDTNK